MVVDNGIKSFHEKISFYNMLCNSNVLIRKYSELSGLRSFGCKVSVQCTFELFNPFHPDISVHILHTALYTFYKVLTRRICLTITGFFSWWSFSANLLISEQILIQILLLGLRCCYSFRISKLALPNLMFIFSFDLYLSGLETT